MSDLPTEITRIDALTTNARNTWFALLGVLVFVGITLMSVEHIDFYGVARATELPLVNFEVPTRYFFIAAPILVAAIYGYFHLYLIRLWDALSVAEAQHEGHPLGDTITPWLVTDAALHMRARLRGDGCTTPRTMEGAAMLLNLCLAWVFGIVVLVFLWWQSMPAREILMTGIAGLALSVSLLVGTASFAMSVIRMRNKSDGKMQNIFSSVPAMSAVLVIVPFAAALSHQRTMGSANRLAAIVMIDEGIVERPKGWVPYGVAKAEYQDAWCKRKDTVCNDLSDPEQTEFDTDWKARRAAILADMRRPYWSDRGTDKTLNWTNANLRFVYLVGANLGGAQMEGADLSFSRIFGLTDQASVLSNINLMESINDGGSMRFVDMTDALWNNKTDFRNTFMDESVSVSKEFRARMGNPCQWLKSDIEDKEEFFALWRWWVEVKLHSFWGPVSPPEYQNIPLPTPERLAELRLTDCEPNQPFGPMPPSD